MITVEVQEGESFEKAFKRFKRLCERERILTEIKKHQYYYKPSEIRRQKLLKLKRKKK